jgi:hypothetical protein
MHGLGDKINARDFVEAIKKTSWPRFYAIKQKHFPNPFFSGANPLLAQRKRPPKEMA